MKSFKTPIIVTAITFGLLIVIGIISITMIHNSSGSSRQKNERAAMVGSGAAVLGGIIVAPFWIYTASKVGQERRKSAKGTKKTKKK